MHEPDAGSPARDELEAAWCWDPDDAVPRRPAMTAFRRRARLEQARWREKNGHPIGTQPHVPVEGRPVRLVGSRIPLPYARETGANLLTPGALDAARTRTSFVERHQSFDHQRLWADLLSSEALAFNVFGDAASDLRLADRAAHVLAPDAPGRVTEVRFAHSPGRLDPAWLNSLREFDAAFVLDRGDGTRGILAVDVTYHERLAREQPKPQNLWRVHEVAGRSGAFDAPTIDAFSARSEFAVLWLEHLLLCSMLQHESGEWTWGRYLVVHPATNPDMTDLVARYRGRLADDTTFATMTLEDLVASDALATRTARLVRDRYLPG